MRKIALLFILFPISLFAQFDIVGAWVGQLDGGYFKMDLKEDKEVFLVYDEDTLYSMDLDSVKVSFTYTFDQKKDTSDFQVVLKVNNLIDEFESFHAKMVVVNDNKLHMVLYYEDEDEPYLLELERIKK